MSNKYETESRKKWPFSEITGEGLELIDVENGDKIDGEDAFKELGLEEDEDTLARLENLDRDLESKDKRTRNAAEALQNIITSHLGPKRSLSLRLHVVGPTKIVNAMETAYDNKQDLSKFDPNDQPLLKTSSPIKSLETKKGAKANGKGKKTKTPEASPVKSGKASKTSTPEKTKKGKKTPVSSPEKSQSKTSTPEKKGKKTKTPEASPEKTKKGKKTPQSSPEKSNKKTKIQKSKKVVHPAEAFEKNKATLTEALNSAFDAGESISIDIKNGKVVPNDDEGYDPFSDSELDQTETILHLVVPNGYESDELDEVEPLYAQLYQDTFNDRPEEEEEEQLSGLDQVFEDGKEKLTKNINENNKKGIKISIDITQGKRIRQKDIGEDQYIIVGPLNGQPPNLELLAPKDTEEDVQDLEEVAQRYIDLYNDIVPNEIGTTEEISKKKKPKSVAEEETTIPTEEEPKKGKKKLTEEETLPKGSKKKPKPLEEESEETLPKEKSKKTNTNNAVESVKIFGAPKSFVTANIPKVANPSKLIEVKKPLSSQESISILTQKLNSIALMTIEDEDIPITSLVREGAKSAKTKPRVKSSVKPIHVATKVKSKLKKAEETIEGEAEEEPDEDLGGEESSEEGGGDEE